MDLSVILATYNEKENIEEMVDRVDRECKKNGISTEIIVVDDNSPDGTAKIVRRLMKKKKNLRLIVRQKKEGLGAALFHGYREAKGRIIGSSDADLSIDPKYIPVIYKKIQSGYDVVTGSRYMPQSRVVGKPAHKIWVSKGAALLASILLNMRLHDYTLNFRFFKRKALSKRLKSTGNVLLAEFLYSAKQQGLKIGEVPIIFVERTRGKSKMKLGREIFLFLIGMLKLGLKI
jgi:dolichol-phosphate mannosyltransferase